LSRYDFPTRELHARPNANRGEEESNHAKINLERKIADEEAVFDELQNSGQRRQSGAVKENSLTHFIEF
jgi:hypothetical protein